MARHIIFMHGRSNKPWVHEPGDFQDPAQVAASGDGLRRLWMKAFLVGLQRHASQATFAYWNQHQDRIHMAYYGDILNTIEDGESDGTLAAMEPTVDQVIADTAGNKIRSPEKFLRGHGADIAGFVAQGLGFKDDLLLLTLKDLRLYVEDHGTASSIRRRLHVILDDLLANDHQVALLPHSLGTLVTYDVLWKISHRSEYSHLHGKKVELMATLGSPLGNRAFLNKFRIDAHFHKNSQFPRNIRRWYNFSAAGDFIAHDARLKNDFRRRGFLRFLENGREKLDHTRLFNPYVGRSGNWNPHKSYGYLLNPTVARRIDQFMQ